MEYIHYDYNNYDVYLNMYGIPLYVCISLIKDFSLKASIYGRGKNDENTDERIDRLYV